MARRRLLAHRKKKALDAVRSEINVTPLVDVVLVLLIIFMVVMPSMSRGMEVKLPEATNYNEREDTSEQPIVSVRSENGVVRTYFDREAMGTPAVLKKRVEDELRRKADQRIFVKADRDLTFGAVYPALMAIHEGGSPGVELGTTEPRE